MTFPVVESLTGGSQASDTTSHSVALPATINADDLLVVMFCADGTPTITWDDVSAGVWTLGATPSGAAGGPRAGVWWKVADGTEGGASLTITTSASEQSAWQIYRISGSTGDIITAANPTTGAWDSPSATTPWSSEDTLWLSMTGYDDGTKTPAGAPTNYTNLTTDRTSTSDGVGVCSARRNNATATENPPSFGTSGNANAVTIGIRPGSRVVSAEPVVMASVSGNADASGTSHSVTLPSSIVAGELLLVFFACRSVATVTWDNSTAGSWNTVVDHVQGIGRPHLTIMSKVADGSESGATLTITTSASSRSAYRSLRIDKAASAEGAAADGGSTATPNPPILTPSFGPDDILWFACVAGDAGNRTLTSSPPNYSSGFAVSTPTDSGGASLFMARRALNVSNENPAAMTISSAAQTVAATIGIEPGPPASGGGGSDWRPRAIICF